MKDAAAILRELEEPGNLSIPTLNDAGALDAAHRAELVAGAVCLLSHSSPGVRGKAAWLLTTVEAGPEHTPALAASLRDPDRSVRFGAARALVRQRERALPALDALIAAFDDKFTPVRDSAGWAVTNIGSPAGPKLVELLTAPTVAARAIAVAVLGNIATIPESFQLALPAPAAASLLPPLVAAIADPESWVSFNAISAVGKITRRFVVPRLVEWLSSPDEHTREQAALELLWLAPHIDNAVPALQAALSDPSELVRGHAAEALNRRGQGPGRAGHAGPHQGVISRETGRPVRKSHRPA
jgi:HEAT repeat protein